MHLHYTVPTVQGPHIPPSCHLFPPQGFILLPVAPAPQCVTLNPTKPITLTVHFSPNAPLCSTQCLIVHPSMQHPKSTTAAPPHPRGHPISSACSSFPDPIKYHPSPTSCMHLHATPPSEPLKTLLHPTLVTLHPLRQCPPAANIWPRRSPQGLYSVNSLQAEPPNPPQVTPSAPVPVKTDTEP